MMTEQVHALLPLAEKIAREFANIPGLPFAQQPVAQLPWGQIIRLMQMVKDPATRDFHIRDALNRGGAFQAQCPNQHPTISSPYQRHAWRKRRVISRKSPRDTNHQKGNRARIEANGAYAQRGFIKRSTGQARGIQLTIAPDLIPPLAQINS